MEDRRFQTSAFIRGRNHGGGGQQTDAGHGEQFLAGGALFGQHGNPAIMPTI